MLDRVKTDPVKYPLWRVEHGLLYRRVHIKYDQLLEEQDRWLLVVPKQRREAIMKSHHDPPICGHLGVFKTTARILQKYYWPGAKCDVAWFIARCLKTKLLQKAPAGQMLSQQPTATRPFEIICLDLVGPLPRSNSGYCYVLSVLDCFSKYVLFFPLRTATTKSILKWLEGYVLLIYGIPRKIIVDNGKQFSSHQFRDCMRLYHNNVQYTSNYHPQVNPVERLHRVLKSIISSYIEDDHRIWEKLLAKAGCAIRSAKHEVTDFTPNFIVFGREPRFTQPTSSLCIQNEIDTD